MFEFESVSVAGISKKKVLKDAQNCTFKNIQHVRNKFEISLNLE